MINERNLPILATLLVFIMLYGFGMYQYQGFRDTLVFSNLLTDNAFLIITAIGMTFVILSGGIDLSVGSMIAFIGVLMAYLISNTGMHPLFAIGIALVVGVAFGAAMGVIIAFFEIQAFIVTLAGMFLFRGLAYLINLDAVPIDHPFIAGLYDIYVPLPGRGGLTFIAMAMLVLLALGILIARRTRFGMSVYALGGDSHSAALLGVPVKKTIIKIYA
ncbi:MAG: sugar ABC transporter permease YjfF, partial [Gammaproteobacteria bacterium]|nr:sugar ABC transporter permease YjfF [Gammaproteobacteria bacterium]